MSWQTYVDDHLMVPLGVGQKPLIGAAILGHDGSIWAQSASFPQVRMMSAAHDPTTEEEEEVPHPWHLRQKRARKDAGRVEDRPAGGGTQS